MARYVTTVRSPWSVDDAFEYVADLRNFAEWDPGVSASELVEGTALEPSAVYEVKANGATLRYKTEELAPPRRFAAEATTRFFKSYDVITVTPNDAGCDVKYDATLTLNGALKIADPILGLFFNKIGSDAANGLREKLDGTIVSS